MKTQNINDISKSQINKAAIMLCDNKSHNSRNKQFLRDSKSMESNS